MTLPPAGAPGAPQPHINPAFLPPRGPGGLPPGSIPGAPPVSQFQPPVGMRPGAPPPHGFPGGAPPAGAPPGGFPPPDQAAPAVPPMSESEMEEHLQRNKQVSSNAISRAVQVVVEHLVRFVLGAISISFPHCDISLSDLTVSRLRWLLLNRNILIRN